VVERERDVIDLVAPMMHESVRTKMTIHHSDWFDWVDRLDPFSRETYNGVFFDLFVGNGVELMGSAIWIMRRLQDKFPQATRRILGFPEEMLERYAGAFAGLETFYASFTEN